MKHYDNHQGLNHTDAVVDYGMHGFNSDVDNISIEASNGNIRNDVHYFSQTHKLPVVRASNQHTFRFMKNSGYKFVQKKRKHENVTAASQGDDDASAPMQPKKKKRTCHGGARRAFLSDQLSEGQCDLKNLHAAY